MFPIRHATPSHTPDRGFTHHTKVFAVLLRSSFIIVDQSSDNVVKHVLTSLMRSSFIICITSCQCFVVVMFAIFIVDKYISQLGWNELQRLLVAPPIAYLGNNTILFLEHFSKSMLQSASQRQTNIINLKVFSCWKDDLVTNKTGLSLL